MSKPSQIGKLDRSFCKEVNRRNVSEVKNIKNNDQNTPMSIDIKIQNIKINALIDTGAEISLIQGNVFNQTPFSKQLNKIPVLGTPDFDWLVAGLVMWET